MFQRTLRREEDQLRTVQLCPIYHGDPGYVLERAQADDALQLADELMIWLPPNFTLAENKELLDNIVEFIAPELGWRPGSVAAARLAGLSLNQWISRSARYCRVIL